MQNPIDEVGPVYGAILVGSGVGALLPALEKFGGFDLLGQLGTSSEIGVVLFAVAGALLLAELFGVYEVTDGE